MDSFGQSPSFSRDQVESRLTMVEELSEELSELLRSMQRGRLSIRNKSNELDFVTEADLESERIISEAVRRHFPHDSILAEEGGRSGHSDDGGTGFTWVVDPVDGTVNYSHGLPLYSISVGIAHEREPVAGIVILPAMNEIYRGIKGAGSTVNGEPLHVAGRESLAKALVVTGFPYNRHEVIDPLVAGVRNVLLSAQGLRRSGSASIDLCWLARGWYDAFYELSLKPWDTCAGVVIAREAGATITDLLGEEYNPFHHEGLAATGGPYHKEFLQCVSPLAR